MPSEATYTYSKQPQTDDKDAVRFNLQDINADGLGWLLSDEEILYMLAQEGNVMQAAIRGAETIATSYAGPKDVAQKRIADLQIMYGTRMSSSLESWQAVAKMLRQRLARGAAPYAGGLSRAEARADQLDTDLVQPAFRRGMMDSRNVPSQEGGPIASTWSDWDSEWL